MKRHPSPYRSGLYRNEHGLALVLVLVLLAVLTVVGLTAVTMTSTDLLVGGNYKSSQRAFYNAEAGVHYTLSRIPGALVTLGRLPGELVTTNLCRDGRTQPRDNRLCLNSTGPQNESYDIGTVPEGFSFELAATGTFKRISNTHKYYFQVTSNPLPNSSIRSTIEAVIQRRSSVPYGIFGDDLVKLNSGGTVYSYDSRIVKDRDPQPDDSTGEADVGSNGVVSAYSETSPLELDGDVILGGKGKDEPAAFLFRGSGERHRPPGDSTVTIDGEDILLKDVAPIVSDPLNVKTVVGEKKENFDDAIENDNEDASIVDNKIDLSKDESIILAPDPNQDATATGNYYLTSLELNDGSRLTIDTSKMNVNIYLGEATLRKGAVFETKGSGKVSIFLDGKLTIESKLEMAGPPTSFFIYSRSEESIDFYQGGPFKGLVYAPYAEIKIYSEKNYGLLWGKRIDMVQDNPSEFYFDMALRDLFPSQNIELLSWKELRN